MAAKAYKISPDRGVMIVEEIVPALVPERGGFLGRADDKAGISQNLMESAP
jgi:hypothetical protein